MSNSNEKITQEKIELKGNILPIQEKPSKLISLKAKLEELISRSGTLGLEKAFLEDSAIHPDLNLEKKPISQEVKPINQESSLVNLKTEVFNTHSKISAWYNSIRLKRNEEKVLLKVKFENLINSLETNSTINREQHKILKSFVESKGVRTTSSFSPILQSLTISPINEKQLNMFKNLVK